MSETATSAAAWQERYQAALSGMFGTPQLVLTRGEGPWVWDADGRRYLDLLGGIAVNALGHCSAPIQRAVAEQFAQLDHVSNFFATEPQILLGERLRALVSASGQPEPQARVFLCNSGTEANEAALKVARALGGKARPRILALTGAFHGRSTGALALTYKEAYRAPFAPLIPGVEFIAPNDVAGLQAAVDETVAAVFLEPIQGEAGVIPLTREFLEAARAATRAAGALLIYDEIQCGMGRTGHWMGYQAIAPEAQPDVITLAKGLGGGLPIGAMVTLTAATSQALSPGMHGTTFGGNPICAAAALAVIEQLSGQGVLARVRDLGERVRAGLRQLRHPAIRAVRGEGLLIGIELTSALAPEVRAALLAEGVIVNAAAPTVVRIAPPLTIPDDLLTAFPAQLARALDRVEAAHHG